MRGERCFFSDSANIQPFVAQLCSFPEGQPMMTQQMVAYICEEWWSGTGFERKKKNQPIRILIEESRGSLPRLSQSVDCGSTCYMINPEDWIQNSAYHHSNTAIIYIPYLFFIPCACLLMWSVCAAGTGVSSEWFPWSKSLICPTCGRRRASKCKARDFNARYHRPFNSSYAPSGKMLLLHIFDASRSRDRQTATNRLWQMQYPEGEGNEFSRTLYLCAFLIDTYNTVCQIWWIHSPDESHKHEIWR